MSAVLSHRHAAEVIEQFGDDLAKLVNAFDAQLNRMPDGFAEVINSIPNQEHLDVIAAAFKERGSDLCEQCDAAEEAEDRARDNPLHPQFRRHGV